MTKILAIDPVEYPGWALIEKGVQPGEVSIVAGSFGSDASCTFCEAGHKPVKFLQLKSRVYRAIPPSKNRSARILKKLMKRQQLMNEPLIVNINADDMIFESIVDSLHLKKLRLKKGKK